MASVVRIGRCHGSVVICSMSLCMIVHCRSGPSADFLMTYGSPCATLLPHRLSSTQPSSPVLAYSVSGQLAHRYVSKQAMGPSNPLDVPEIANMVASLSRRKTLQAASVFPRTGTIYSFLIFGESLLSGSEIVRLLEGAFTLAQIETVSTNIGT